MRSRKKWRHSLSILLVILGILVLNYPVASTLLINIAQQNQVEEILQQTQEEPSRADARVDSARLYNERSKGEPILDPFLQRVAPDTPQYQAYLKELDFGREIMGSVKIPDIGVSLPIYHGTFEDALSQGAGHLFGTALPVGGEGTHSVITAHSGLSNATMFDNLPKLKIGGHIYLFIGNETLKYEVISTETVVPTDVRSLYPQDDKDLLTLITCTPYGVNSHRLLVHAQRVPIDEEEAQRVRVQHYNYWQWWMFIPVGIIILTLCAPFWLPRITKVIHGVIEKNVEKRKENAQI